MDIEGRQVLVTGGQRGLGAAFAAAFLDAGAARVHVTARTPRPVEDDRLVPIALDVTDDATVQAVADQLPEVSIVVNNAGVTAEGGLLDAPLTAAQDVFDANVFGPLRIARAFAPQLRRGSGALVNIASVLAFVGGAGAYGASKAALWSISNSLRLELRDAHVLVTSVHLGLAETDMTEGRFAGLPKLVPAAVAAAVIEGIRHDRPEVLADNWSRNAKQMLSGPVEELTAPNALRYRAG